MSKYTVDSITDPRGGYAHFVHTEHVNWVLLQDDSGLTLIDGGYPGQLNTVLESIAHIGAQPSDIRAALVTHAHVDHIGGLRILSQRYGFPVYTDPAEVAHVHRDYIEQASTWDVLKLMYRPKALSWLLHTLPMGLLSHDPIESARPFPAHGISDLPGHPTAVACAGHTRGHSGYLVADGLVFVSGDALITGHATSGHHGPQCIHRAFHADEERNRQSLRDLAELKATIIFPGHGPAHHGSISDAIHTALE